MVLSNKKLKQQLRAELLAQSTALVISSSCNSNSNLTNPQPQQSLRWLLDLKTQKPRLNKREKRRRAISSKGLEAANESNDENTDAHFVRREKENKEADGKERSESDGGAEKGRKRKRGKEDKEGEVGDLVDGNEENGGVGRKKKKEKRNKGQKGGGDGKVGSVEGDDVKMEASKSIKKKEKKKKKKKKKKVKKVKGEEQRKGPMTENTVNEGVAQEVDNWNSQGGSEVSNRVYVGGIPYYSTEEDIRSYFDHCGTITDVDCMKFPESGKFRGIAIISFKTEEAARRALALDGADMGGLFLKIQPYKSTRLTKTSDFSPPVIEGYNRIYVGNLSWDITEDDLRKLFSNFSISCIRFGEEKETGEFRGYAHVDFSDSASLTGALKLDQRMVCGRPVRIRCAVPKTGAETHSGSAPPATEAGGNGMSSGKLKRRTCYECGERGHISSACPQKQAADKAKPSS
ncbi:hypothetical protein Ancab_023436 [Ancistrocladus abbreviatus]